MSPLFTTFLYWLIAFCLVLAIIWELFSLWHAHRKENKSK